MKHSYLLLATLLIPSLHATSPKQESNPIRLKQNTALNPSTNGKRQQPNTHTLINTNLSTQLQNQGQHLIKAKEELKEKLEKGIEKLNKKRNQTITTNKVDETHPFTSLSKKEKANNKLEKTINQPQKRLQHLPNADQHQTDHEDNEEDQKEETDQEDQDTEDDATTYDTLSAEKVDNTPLQADTNGASTDSEQRTALHLACEGGYLEIAKWLISKPVSDIATTDNEDQEDEFE